MLLTFSFATLSMAKAQHLKSIRGTAEIYILHYTTVEPSCWTLWPDPEQEFCHLMQWRLAKLQFTAETKVFHCATGAGSQAKLNLQNATRSARPRISKDFQDSISMIPTANCTKAVIVRPISVKSLNQSETAFRTIVSSKKVPAKCKSLVVEINQSIYQSIHRSIHPSTYPPIQAYA